MTITNTTHVPTTHSHGSIRSFLTTSPVWLVAVAATVTGAVVTEVFGLIARAIDIPVEAASPGNSTPEEIPISGFATSVLFSSVFGIVLAVALARWAKRPARTFVVTTVVLTALSFISPIAYANSDTASEVTLVLAHVVAAAVIIPLVAYRLNHVDTSRRNNS